MSNQVKIYEKLIDEAEKKAVVRMKYGFRGPIKNNDYKYTMLLISCIGELAFQEFLKVNNIRFSFFDKSLVGKKIEIKDKVYEIRTSGYDKGFKHLNLIYNYEQYLETMDVDFVVQIFINGYQSQNNTFDRSQCTEAQIIGFIDFDKIKQHPLVPNRYRENYKVNQDYLKNVKSLINVS